MSHKITLELDGAETIHEFYTIDRQFILAIDKLCFSSHVTDYYSIDKFTRQVKEHGLRSEGREVTTVDPNDTLH